VPNVQWKTPDDEQRNCSKHVEFRDKNKLVRLFVLLKRKFPDKIHEYSSEAMILCYHCRVIIYIINYAHTHICIYIYIYTYIRKMKRNKWKSQPQTP